MFLIQLNNLTDERGDPMLPTFKGLPVGTLLGVSRTLKQAQTIIHGHYYSRRLAEMPEAGYLIRYIDIDSVIVPDADVPYIWWKALKGFNKFSRLTLRTHRKSGKEMPSEDTSITIKRKRTPAKSKLKTSAEAVHEEF